MDVSTTLLRTARAVAELGSVSAAARSLGFTQSAVSRQIASLEQGLGHALFVRTPRGMRTTREGAILLRAAVDIISRLDASAAEIAGVTLSRVVRVGASPAAGTVLLPPVIAALQVSRPDLELRSRQGSTPEVVRALRSGALDLAVISQRPPYREPDGDSPRLRIDPLFETELVIAAAPDFFAGNSVDADDLIGAPWIAPRATADEPQIGVWPGLPGRARVSHRVNDWLVRLRLAASGAGITALPGAHLATLVPGLRTWHVDGLPAETRRVSVAYRAEEGANAAALTAVLDEFAAVADAIDDGIERG